MSYESTQQDNDNERGFWEDKTRQLLRARVAELEDLLRRYQEAHEAQRTMRALYASETYWWDEKISDALNLAEEIAEQVP